MVRLYILGGIAVFAFQLYCLLDAITAEAMTIRNLPKMVWVLLVLFFPLVGGIAWMVAGRPEHATLHQGGRRSSGRRGANERGRGLPPAPRGPDDDPDFLRRLDRQRFEDDDERG